MFPENGSLSWVEGLFKSLDRRKKYKVWCLDEAAEAREDVETRDRKDPRREPIVDPPGDSGGVA